MSVHFITKIAEDFSRRVAPSIGRTVTIAMIFTALWWPLEGSAQPPGSYAEAVTYCHQDGTDGTSVGFWQQMRDASASLSLAIITGPGDGNTWRNIGGTNYVLMSTLVDQGQYDILSGIGRNTPISGTSSYDGQIWLTPGHSLNEYLLARQGEWNAATIDSRATQAVGADFVFGPDQHQPFRYEASLWVNPDELFRPAVNWNVASSLVYQTANHRNWYPYDTQSQISGDVFSDGSASYSFTQAYGYDYLTWYQDWWRSSGDSNDPDYFPFPWTGLGFTYDWYYQGQAAANPSSIIGLSEFVFAQHPNSSSPVDFVYYLEDLDTIAVSVAKTAAVPEPTLGVVASVLFLLTGSLRLHRRRLRRGKCLVLAAD